MKTTYLILAFLMISISISTAQTLTLVDIVVVENGEGYKPKVFADSYGGQISFDRKYRSDNCMGAYNIVWGFDRDITYLEKGDKFTVYIECMSCRSACGYKWTKATALGGNNIVTSVPGYNIPYNGNIGNYSNTNGGVVKTWDSTTRTASVTLEANMNKQAQYSAFFITAGDHKIYYVYESTTTSSAGPVNCHTLLGLGMLVGNLSIGAYQGYNWDWMVKTIDYALNHVKASNCISDVYLKDLKSRITGSSNTKSFYNEISGYAKKLEVEAAACDCCDTVGTF